MAGSPFGLTRVARGSSRAGQREPRPGRHRVRTSVWTVVLVSAVALVPFLETGAASAADLAPQISEQSVVDVAFDTAGNLYESEFNGNVNVWPTTSGTIFGQAVTAGQANTLVTLNNATAIAFDSAGDLFISNDDGASGGSISVLPATSGTIFGQSVAANTLTTLVPALDDPQGLAFDASGNLYYATQNGISVLPLADGTIFGQSVTADIPTSLVTGLTEGGFVALDAAGDLFYTDVGDQIGGAASVNVLPQSTTTIFGQSVTTDTPATLVSGLTDAAGLSIDILGNLYVNDDGTVGVLSSSSSPIDGTSVTANTLSTLAVGLAFDLGSTYFNGHVYIADQGMDSVDQLTTPTATISGVTFGGSATNPIMIVTGTGFATSRPTYPIGCNGTGSDYRYGDLFLSDTTNAWGAGIPGDCIGLTVGKQKSTKVAFGLGTFYTTGFQLNSGDAFTVGVDGTTFSGTVSYAPPSGATVTNLYPRSGPGGGGTAVTITGTGLSGTKYVFFGSSPATHVSVKSATEVTAVAPSGSATVDVTAVTGSGGVSTAGTRDTFTYLAPTITSISPTKGSTAGGKTVTLRGTNFGGATAVTFGSTPASSFTVNSETEATAVTPEQSAGIEPVTVTTPGGTSNSANFRFKTPA
jgi:IPT/TIG domain